MSPSGEPTRGEKLADSCAKVVGSWRFIGAQAGAILLWVMLNGTTAIKADPYPFILLNLMLSFQAAFTGPVLLMASNRQADLDRAKLHEDYELDKDSIGHLLKVHDKLEDLENHLNHIKRLVD